MTTENIVLRFDRVEKVYRAGAGSPEIRAVDGISFDLARGSFAALIGPSGSGKTTVLNLASGLDRPTSGTVTLAGRNLTGMGLSALSRFRRDRLGFVFQAYNLFPVLTAVENVEFTSLLRGDRPAEARERALSSLHAVGLSDKLNAYPAMLSGGQQQRVAVARALASQPELIFADEPTANLDSKTALQLIELFEEINRSRGITFLFSTHDPRLVDRVKTVFPVRDGKLA